MPFKPKFDLFGLNPTSSEMKDLFILCLALLLIAPNANACSCIMRKAPLKTNVKRAFAQSQYIFSGRAIKKELKTTEYDSEVSAIVQKYVRYVVTFEITQNFKGKKESKFVEIVTSEDSGSCGFNFEVGKVYLVYAYESEYRLSSNFILAQDKVAPFLATDICTRTKPAGNANRKELRFLSKLNKKRKRNLPIDSQIRIRIGMKLCGKSLLICLNMRVNQANLWQN